MPTDDDEMKLMMGSKWAPSIYSENSLDSARSLPFFFFVFIIFCFLILQYISIRQSRGFRIFGGKLCILQGLLQST